MATKTFNIGGGNFNNPTGRENDPEKIKTHTQIIKLWNQSNVPTELPEFIKTENIISCSCTVSGINDSGLNNLYMTLCGTKSGETWLMTFNADNQYGCTIFKNGTVKNDKNAANLTIAYIEES